MKIPSNVVDNTPTPFPAGVYDSELSETVDRWSPDQQTMFVGTTWTNNKAADSTTPDVGDRPFFEDICVRYDGESLFELKEITGDTPFLLRRGAGILAGLAWAFGIVERTTDEDIELDLPGFVQDLRDGKYNGRKARIQVEHNVRKIKGAPEGTPPRVNAQARRIVPSS